MTPRTPQRTQPPSPTLRFLHAALNQARDRLQRFRHRLLLHRRTQTRTALTITLFSTFLLHALATPAAPRCDTLPASTTTSPPVPADWRVIAMPGGLALPQLSPGDAVDIVSDGVVVAPGALVVAPPVSDRGDQQGQGALVAVPMAAAATVATAAQNGGIALVVVPG